MKLLFVILSLFTVINAIEPHNTTGFVSTNFANADIEATEKSSETFQRDSLSNSAERRNIKVEGKKTSFKAKPFVATGFFIAAAITGYLGYDANQDAEYYKKEYDNSTTPEEVEANKKKIEDAEKKRNAYYIASGASLVGFTVTLTLF